MRTLTPAGGITGLKNEMNRLIDRFRDADFTLPTIGDWVPAMDLSETDESVMVKMDVPGFEPRDIHITPRDTLLTVRGEKHVETEKQEEKYYRAERATGPFIRIVRLPAAVDAAKVQTTFKNGVLSILLRKAPRREE